MYSLSRGCVTRQGVVITDLKSLLDYQLNFSLFLSLSHKNTFRMPTKRLKRASLRMGFSGRGGLLQQTISIECQRNLLSHSPPPLPFSNFFLARARGGRQRPATAGSRIQQCTRTQGYTLPTRLCEYLVPPWYQVFTETRACGR